MTTHRTFYLVPADVVAKPTIAVPRPLAPSPRISPPASKLHKPAVAPLKRPPLCADPIEVLLGDTPHPHQRKRECLDHLTHEQKMNRRKMKNRIAAQTARDRKKYRSQRLEDIIRELLEQNETLKQENELLRIENRELSEQNSSLLSRLSEPEDVPCQVNPSQSTVVYEEVHEMITEKSGAAVESAAFISGPLPRVQVVPLYLLFHLMINLLLVHLEFDLDLLVEQLPEEECNLQYDMQPGNSVGSPCQQPACSSSGSASPVDASFLSVPSPSFSTCFPSPSNYSHSMDELILFEDQKLLDDPMLSSPSSWQVDHPNAMSPFSDSFQKEFFHMLE
ncbi:basic region leucine zipper [Necator americanus]|uniref:X-box-binding protein 1 n=1 Tax=Necator americanus TaxID=51031 RepID=W2T7T1_NECAM|nr:basic region leucine zipper [Necator americanus]ETN78075.1 basic region leucine zipper [Necator americanus]